MLMKRTDWKYLVDTLLFISGFSTAAIGFLMGVVIPGGPGAPETEKYFLGLQRHQWGGFHFALSIAFFALLLVHLVLEWSWIRGKACQVFGRRWRGALVLTVVAVGATLFLFWLLTEGKGSATDGRGGGGRRWQTLESRSESVVSAPSPAVTEKSQPGSEARSPEAMLNRVRPQDRDRSERQNEDLIIDGRVSLLDIQRMTGIKADDIAYRLGLPPGVPFDLPLGRLRRTFGFSMDDVRRALKSPARGIETENEKNETGDNQ
jgi:hypothetical protein